MAKILADNSKSAPDSELAGNMLRAAFLALERDGSLELNVRSGENGAGETLTATPTGKLVSFGKNTIEGRLNITKTATVEDIVYDWLRVDSRAPWKRAVEQGSVALAIKGLVLVNGTVDRDYQLSSGGVEAVKTNTAALETTKKLLDDCEQQNTSKWTLLYRDISAAVTRRTYHLKGYDDHYEAPSPLDDEAQVDRESVQSSKTPGIAVFFIVSAIAGVGIICMTMLYEYVKEHSIAFALLFLALAGLLVAALVLKKTKDAINKKVLGNVKDDSQPAGDMITTDGNADIAGKQVGATESTKTEVWKTEVKLDIIDTASLPPLSAESIERLEAIANREPAYYKLCQRVVFVISTAFTALVLIYGLAFRVPTIAQDFGYQFFFLLLFYGYTLLMLNRRVAIWVTRAAVWMAESLVVQALFGEGSRVDAPAKKEQEYHLRPTGKMLITWCWLVLIAYVAIEHFSRIPHITTRVVFLLCSAAIAIGSYIWYKQQRLALEQKYPFRPPVNMLALRVFGSPYLTDFLRLTKSWQWLGTTQRLDGPDTTGEKESDIFNYLTGRIDRSIVKTQAELDLAAKRIKQLPDRKLRFPLNSMQCMDATWKQALQVLLDEVDVIVMDFSNLSEKNKGVAFEAGKIFDQYAKERIIFLINDSTDRQVLQEIMNKSWNNRLATSPNGPDAEATICCYNTGVMPARNDKESYYDWKKRFETPVDGDHLVGLIYDRAQPAKRPPVQLELKTHRYAIHWTKLPIHYYLELGLKAALCVGLVWWVVKRII